MRLQMPGSRLDRAWEGLTCSSTSSIEKTDLEVPSFSHVRSGSFLATRALIVHVSLYGVSVLTGCADRRRFELGAPVLSGLRGGADAC